MAIGSKDKYTDKQKRKAKKIEESYLHQGLSPDESEKIAWATVNKQTGGGEKSGSGKSMPEHKKKQARKDSAHNAVTTKKEKSKPNALENWTLVELKEKARKDDIAGRSSMNKADLIQALRRH